MAELKRPTGPAGAHQGGDLMKMFEGPGEETLGEAQKRQVGAARNVFKELEKLVRAIGLYGNDHQGTQRFRAIFRQAILAMLTDENDQVDVHVGPYEFTLFDQVVYQNANPEKNFVYKFFQDGVRRLRFDMGVTDKELDDFLDVLLTNWDDPTLFEDDSVTIMWSKSFEHIDYKVIESFREDGAAPGEDEGYTVDAVITRVKSAGKPPESIQVRAQGAPARAQAGPGGRGGAGAGSGDAALAGGRKSDLSTSLLTDRDLEKFQESPFAMDEHEFGVLRGIVESAGATTLEKFIEILFKVNLVDDENARSRVMGSLDKIVELLLSAARFGDLERVMLKVRGLTGPEGELIFENLDAINRIFDRWGTPAFVDAVIERLNNPHETETTTLTRMLQLLNPGAGLEVARAAGRLQIPDRRVAVFELLPEMVAGQLKEVGRLLQSCDAAHAHDLIRMLRSIEGVEILAAINGALNNPDAAVRLEALTNLPTEKLHVYLPHVLNAMKDKSKVVRGKAVHLLARMPSPQVHTHLLQRIKDRDFGDIDLDEKRRFFAAAALTGNPTEWFVQLLEDRSLLQRKDTEEMRSCAAIGLALRMHGPSLPNFDREVKRKLQTDVVRDACAWALHHVRQSREERTRQLYDILFKGTLSYAHGSQPGGTT